jgi:hypothetical protein
LLKRHIGVLVAVQEKGRRVVVTYVLEKAVLPELGCIRKRIVLEPSGDIEG